MLSLTRGPDTVALEAICQAVDEATDYWTARGLADLHVLDTLFMDAVGRHYGDGPEAAERMGRDGFGADDHFDRFAGAVLAARVHLPGFPIIKYKGGGFSCTSLP